MKTLLLTSVAIGAAAVGYAANYAREIAAIVEPYIKQLIDTNTDVCANGTTIKVLRQVLAKSTYVKGTIAAQLPDMDNVIMMPNEEFAETLHASDMKNSGEVGPQKWSCSAVVRYQLSESGDDKVDRPGTNGISLGPNVAVRGAARPLQVSYTAQVNGDEIWVRVFRTNWGLQ